MNIQIFDRVLEDFIQSLEKATIAKILRTIDLLKLFGNKLSLPHSKNIAPHLFELRIRGIQEVRIIYAFHGSEAILLHGFLKSTARLPKKELALAITKFKKLQTPS